MRRLQRLIAASVLVALSGAVAGCSSSFSSWDPSDLLDWIDTKKKLPGERKPVFPEGVPGLEQGVPKQLYKGAAQQQEIDRQSAQAAAAAAPPPQDAKSKRAAKSKSKSQDAAGTDPAATPEEDAAAATPQAAKPKKIVRQRTTAPPPDQPADPQPAQPASPTQQSAAPFPAPLPGNTFQR
jgi:hypothetical protein